MATRYGKTFRSRRGRLGRYKYVNGRRVSFTSIRGRRYSTRNFSSRAKYYSPKKNRTYFQRRY